MQSFDTTIWIVHREPGPRAALGRLAGAAAGRHEIVLGRPGDAVFDVAAPADVVVLDVSTGVAAPEPEIDLARRIQRDNPDCAWILITESGALEATLRLFDSLDARVIAGPPDARTMAAAVGAALAHSRVLPLSDRIGRDYLSARFVRWFSAGEPRELALALDPRLAAEPVLARGETGTGRGLLLRYVHVTSTVQPGPFVRVACGSRPRPDELIAQIEDGVREAGHARGRFGIWLDELDRLDESVQARLLDWIEFGLPRALPATLRGNVRWFASAGDDPLRLNARLALAFAELTICTVPLRERSAVVPSFVADTARAWASARRESPKTFDPPAIDLLRGEPWPGNLAELEAVVIRTLAHVDPKAHSVRIADLRFGPEVEHGAPVTASPRAQAPREPDPAPVTAAVPPAAAAPEPTPVLLPPSRPQAPPPEPAPEPAEPAPWPGELDVLGPASDGEPELEALLEPDLEGEAPLPEAIEVVEVELPPLPAPPPESAPVPDAATADAPALGAARDGTQDVARLAKAVAHEVRNPLVSIRTFSDLLHDHYADEEFRDHFGRIVADDVRRIEQVVDQLEQMGDPEPAGALQRIDMTAMLESLLDDQRANIQARRLLVLKELDRARPEALGDETVLRTALAGLLDRAIGETPERGDLYLASRHRSDNGDRASMRIVLRYRVLETPSDGDLAVETLRTTSLQAEVGEAMIERLGGSLRVDTTNPTETVVVVDLPAPPAPR